MGETIELSEPQKVDIDARVHFDHKRDLVAELEVIENGVVVRTVPVGRLGATRIVGQFQHPIRRSGWLAVRTSGWKKGNPRGRQSLAHSAPIYVSVANASPLARTEEARRMAHSWLVLLDDLEEALSEKHIEELAERAAMGKVDAATIRKNRPGLLRAIKEARDYYLEQSR